MRRMTGILAVGLVVFESCRSESSRPADGSDVLAAAGLPGSVPVSTTAGQDSTPLVARRVWQPDFHPFWGGPSPEGRYLSFTDWTKGDLAIHDILTGEDRLLTSDGSLPESHEFALNSTFAPDGRRVAYAWENLDGYHELRVVGLDGSRPRVLLSDPAINVYPREWSRDGEQILVSVESLEKEQSNHIGLVAAADGSLSLLKELDGRGDGMSLSPDGRFVVYEFSTDEDSPERDIYVIDVEAGGEHSLVEHSADDRILGWAPDGKHVLFASDRTGTLGAWLLPVADGRSAGEPWLVKPDMWRVEPIGFARNGSYFYSISTRMVDVYVAAFDPETAELIETPTLVSQRFQGSNSDPTWSPDGRYLAYISVRGTAAGVLGSDVVVIRSVETGEVRELEPKLIRIGHLRWSPDGGSLLVRGRDEKNRRGLYQIDVQTAEMTPLLEHETAAYGEWTADGKALVLYAFGEGARISRRSLESGDEEVLYRGPAPSFVVEPLGISPDGSEIAFVHHDEEGTASFMIMPVAGGAPRELVHFERGESWPIMNFRWSIDGRYVFYVRGGDKAAGLWRVPVEGGVPKKLEWYTEVNAGQLRFHPDGRRIALTRGQAGNEVWVMEDFLPATLDTSDER